jgi:hypothetical protein
MKQVSKLNKLSTLDFFDANTVAQITDGQGDTLYKNIARWIEQGKLIQLKKGFYTTREYYLNLENKNSYLEFISNKLRFPSYLSLEYVLAANQVLTESVFTYTSITLKTTRSYSNDLGRFSYRSITSKLFCGYDIVQKNGFEIAQASKAKALFDYLYLKLYRQPKITQDMIDSLRLNLDEFGTDEIAEFVKYCQLSGIKKYQSSIKLLFPNYAN